VILTSKCCCLSLILKKFQKKSCVSAEVNFVGFTVMTVSMLKSKRKNIKMKSSLKLHLKDFRCFFILFLSQNVKNININKFKDIDSVNLTRKKTLTRALFMFLIH